MALNLFEYTKMKPTEDEYAVASLRDRLQNDDDKKQEQYEITQMHQKLLDELQAEQMNIAKQIEEETDAKKLLQLKKILNFSTQQSEKMQTDLQQQKAKWRAKTETIDYKMNEFAQYWLQQEPYAESFAQAYRITDEAFKRGDDAKIKFVPFSEEVDTHRLKPEGRFYQEVITDGKPFEYFALQVDLGNGLPFNIVMEPSDRNDARTQMRIVLAPEDMENQDFDNPAVFAENKTKIRSIMEFCEKYGFSTFDMHIPMTFDGSVDENAFYEKSREKLQEKEKRKQELLQEMFETAKEEKRAEDIENWQKEADENDKKLREIKEYAAQHPEEKIDVNDYSLDEVPTMQFGTASLPLDEDNTTPMYDNAAAGSNDTSAGNQTNAFTAQSPKKWTLAEVEKIMEEMLGGTGLNKERNKTFFKKGMFHSSWTEYVVYDKPGADKDDGRRDPKTDVAQYTYAYKLFVSVDDNGNLTFSYRRNNGAKIDNLVNAMVGKFKDMGITHINFPVGLPDDEKTLWRKALAEKGIVYKGMGIDVDKAMGMIQTAKDKHLPSDKMIEFKYRIALQMQENNANKGKNPSDDEADFIGGLINTYQYRGFTNGYARGLKSLINKTLIAGDKDFGAVNKIAAYRAFRQVFDIYQEILRTGSVANLRVGTIQEIVYSANPQEENVVQKFVTAEQRQKLLALNLSNDISQITSEQLIEIYKALLPEHRETAKNEIYTMLDNNRLKDIKVLGSRALPANLVQNIFNEAKKSVDAINSDSLAAMGVDEISLPKDGRVSLGIGDYTKKVEAEAARQAEEARAAAAASTPSRSTATPIKPDSSRSL
ncbi:MAG: hypothetical protein IJ099_06805 [Alphaproteobacteria bacterium]|nr:hypothetical protein [Alphaproteobacteria bacterium]